MATTLNAEARTERGKNVARRLRRSGRVPAVVYGEGDGSSGQEALAISVSPDALYGVLRSDSGVNTLIGLILDGGQPSQVLIKDYQVDPISHDFLHVDFFRVEMDKAITVTVPIELTGEADGVKVQGGLIDFVQRDVAITCLPADIPERISVDISSLMIGDGVRLRDLLEGVAGTPVGGSGEDPRGHSGDRGSKRDPHLDRKLSRRRGGSRVRHPRWGRWRVRGVSP